MSSLEDVRLLEYNPDDILCNPDSYKIGGGATTLVCVGYNRVLKQTVAIKIFRLTGNQEDILQIVEHAKEEGKLMQLARHKNVVQVYGFVKWPTAFGIVMEYCECENLLIVQRIRNIHTQIPLCVHILTQVASGIAFLHNLPDQYVIHGNPNPSHILLTHKKDVKLSGFGFAELVSSSDDSRMTKTRKTNVLSFYAAPERLKHPAMKLTKALDVYTFAISTYIMLTGRFPLVEERTYSKNIYECMQNLNAQNKQSINVIVDLMEKCLNHDPSKRPTMKEVADVLLKLLDEQDKDVLLEQVETVTWSVRNMFDFSNLEKLVPISKLPPFYVFDQPSIASSSCVTSPVDPIQVSLPEFNPGDILCNPDLYKIGGRAKTVVWVGYNRVLKQTVAIKIFRLTGTPEDILQIVEHAKEEGKLMQLVRHENVVQVYGFVKWPTAFGIVMEYCECGNLLIVQRIRNIHTQIPLCVHILTQVASGIAFLHNLPDQYVIHGNPNPSHILLTHKKGVKLSGFGFAELVSSSDDSRMTKTRKTNVLNSYAAPERLKNPAMKLTKALDVYTFAISTYVMLTGRFPFVEERTSYSKNIYESMQKLNAQDKQSINVIVDLIEKCLNDDHLMRPSMREVADVLLKLLDEQDKGVLLQQVETDTWGVRNMFDFSSLKNLIPISELFDFGQPSSRFSTAQSYSGSDAKKPKDASSLTLPVEEGVKYSVTSHESQATDPQQGSFSTAQSYSGSDVTKPKDASSLTLPVEKGVKYSVTAHETQATDPKKDASSLTLTVEEGVKYSVTSHESQATDPQQGSFSTAQSYSGSDVTKPKDASSLTLPVEKGVKYSRISHESQATDPKKESRVLMMTEFSLAFEEEISEVASSSGVTSPIDPKQISDHPFLKASVGITGATLNIGGCKVIFPAMAVWKKVTIQISVLYQEADDVIRLTPMLQCEPHGLTFRKKIEIVLPTFYRADGDALDVAVRRAKDKFSSFEKIGMDMLLDDTQHFTFTTDQFSLFDYILFDASKRMNLLREKVLIFGLRPNTEEAPKEIFSAVLVCHDKESAMELYNINKLMKTNFFLKYEDHKLKLELKGEHLNALTEEIRDARCERDETCFRMKKNNNQGWISDDIEVCLTSSSDETLVKKIVTINKEDRVPRPQSDVTTNFSQSTFHNATVNTSLLHNERDSNTLWSKCSIL